MSEPTTANAVSPDAVDNLKKQLEDLHKKKAFLHLPRLIVSIAVGVTFGSLAYMSSSNLASALLIGLAVSIASISLNEAELLRKHTDAILTVLDDQTSTSKPGRAE